MLTEFLGYVTIQQLNKSRDDARLRQHGGAGFVHRNRSNHYHHLQHEVVLC